ncbi:MAG TPA: LPS export ABC transporter periplasmic protein LptC [Chitinophagaceae bacterium]|nr:LPS export ABC transporter periplasmic protein LptC [Chitinophagaceae bacterium]
MNSFISILRKYFFAAALITGCCLIYACENDEKVIKELTEQRKTVEKGTNIESYLSQNGSVKAKLVSPLMLRVIDTAPYVEFPNTLHVDFYNDSLQVETRLDSKYGKYFEKLDKVYLRDSVVVISVKGDTLKAPELWWDQNAKLFYTDSVAEYHSIDKRITGGKGLVATQDMSEVTFKYPTGPVKVPKDMQ